MFIANYSPNQYRAGLPLGDFALRFFEQFMVANIKIKYISRNN